jgi:hypothetical protein
MGIAINGRQRELWYGVVLDRLTGIDEVWLTIAAGEWEKAQRLCREYSDLLRLLVDGLGWEKGRHETVLLTCPPDVLLGAVEAIRRAAAVETEEERERRLDVAEVQVDRRDTLIACDEVLQKLG